MKNVFSFLAITVSLSTLIGCTTAGTANSSNQNSAAPNANQTAAVVNQNPANSAVAEQKAPEEVPTFTDANEALAAGKKYFDEIENEKAINAFELAVKLDPNLAEAHFQLGILYEARERDEVPDTTEETKPAKNKKAKPAEKPSEKAFKEAIRIYEKNIKKDSKDAASHYFLGLAFAKIFEDPKAEKALRQAVKLQPDDGEYNYELGLTLIKLAQYAEAVKFLKKTLEIDPDNIRAQEALEEAESGRKRVDFAKKDNQSKQQKEILEQHQNIPTRPRNRSSKSNSATAGNTSKDSVSEPKTVPTPQ